MSKRRSPKYIKNPRDKDQNDIESLQNDQIQVPNWFNPKNNIARNHPFGGNGSGRSRGITSGSIRFVPAQSPDFGLNVREINGVVYPILNERKSPLSLNAPLGSAGITTLTINDYEDGLTTQDPLDLGNRDWAISAVV